MMDSGQNIAVPRVADYNQLITLIKTITICE